MHHPSRHAVRVLLALGLGYFYPLAVLAGECLLLVALFALLPWMPLFYDPVYSLMFWGIGLIVALFLTTRLFMSMSLSRDEPCAMRLASNQAPELWGLIDEVRIAMYAHPVKELYIDLGSNASIVHIPHWGPFGRPRSRLLVGIVLLMELQVEELKAVLAHEFAHLNRKHARFGSWVWRMQGIWNNLASAPEGKRSISWAMLGWFLKKYPRWLHVTTLASRRRHELDADGLAAEVTGSKSAGRALLRASWQDYRLGCDFWPKMDERAKEEELPPRDIYQCIGNFLDSQPTEGLYGKWKTRWERRQSSLLYTHPLLVERLEFMGLTSEMDQIMPPEIPSPPTAIELLGVDKKDCMEYLNRLWKALAMSRWRSKHAAR